MGSPNETPTPSKGHFRERFPALIRLERAARGTRIPYVQQNTAADCGAACLAMVLGYHGRHVRLDSLRETMGTGRDGVNALSLVQAARRFNLRGRGVTLEVADLDYVPPASILHWSFDHFVVYEGREGDLIKLVDPALGPRRVSREEFGHNFTGVALIFEPMETFTTGREATRRMSSRRDSRGSSDMGGRTRRCVGRTAPRGGGPAPTRRVPHRPRGSAGATEPLRPVARAQGGGAGARRGTEGGATSPRTRGRWRPRDGSAPP